MANTGIENKWNQFNGAITQLGTYKGTSINLRAPAASNTVRQKADWIGALNRAFKVSMGVYEAYRDKEYKEAENYLNTHSLSDYKKQIQEGDVPFQYDYLAMSHLKELMGNTVQNLATQDFQQEIARNAFKGKSPEEVDAAFYQKLQEYKSSFSADELGFNPQNDKFFEQGLYKDADKTRVGLLLEQAKVEDDALQQEYERQILANIDNAINDPNSNPQNLINAFNSFSQMNYRNSPDFIYKVANHILESLKEHPNGTAYLNALKDVKIANGVSFYNYIGDAAYKTAMSNAAGYKFKYDGYENAKITLGIHQRALQGDVVGLKSLLEQELKRSGGVNNPIVQKLIGGIAQAQNVQLANQKSAQAQEAQAQEALGFSNDVYNMILGNQSQMSSASIKERYPNLKDYEKNYIIEQVAQSMWNSGDKNIQKQLLTYATKNGSFHALVTPIKNALTNDMRLITNALEYAASHGGLLPEADQTVLDANGQPQKIRSSDVALQRLSDLNKISPTLITSFLNPADAKTFNLLNMEKLADPNSTESPLQSLAKARAAKQLIEDKAKADGQYWGQFDAGTNSTILDSDFMQSVSPVLQPFVARQLELKILEYASTYMSAHPDKDISDVLTTAAKLAAQEYSVIGGAVVPKNLLSSASNNLDTQKVAQGMSADTFNEYAAEVFQRDVIDNPAFSIQSELDYSRSFVDYNTNQLVIVDANGNNRGAYPLDKLADNTAAYIETKLNKVPTKHKEEQLKEEEQVDRVLRTASGQY